MIVAGRFAVFLCILALGFVLPSTAGARDSEKKDRDANNRSTPAHQAPSRGAPSPAPDRGRAHNPSSYTPRDNPSRSAPSYAPRGDSGRGSRANPSPAARQPSNRVSRPDNAPGYSAGRFESPNRGRDSSGGGNSGQRRAGSFGAALDSTTPRYRNDTPARRNDTGTPRTPNAYDRRGGDAAPSYRPRSDDVRAPRSYSRDADAGVSRDRRSAGRPNPYSDALSPTSHVDRNRPQRAPGVHARGEDHGTRLDASASRSTLGQMNRERHGMRGVNARPLPVGEITRRSNGATSLQASHARYDMRANGSVIAYAAHGRAARFRSNGTVSAVRTGNLGVYRTARGQRTILTRYTNRGVLVGSGRHGGYLARGYTYAGHTYVRRSYAMRGARFHRYYVPYRWHGVALARYATPAWYAPAYYGWAYGGWGAPVSYRWGWLESPWYGYHRSYFSPYPSYRSASFWLTDYALASTLDASYDEGADDAYGDASDYALASDDAVPISTELKDAIADDVERYLREQQGLARNGGAEASQDDFVDSLRPGSPFIVNTNLDAATTDDTLCGLSAGNILRVAEAPQGDATDVVLRVASTRRGDCPAGTEVALPLQDLQEMRNAMLAAIDDGMAKMQADVRAGSLPRAPADAMAAPRQVFAGDGGDDEDVAGLLVGQGVLGDRIEKSAAQSVGDDSDAAPNELAQVLDDILVADARSWMINHYDRGSIFDAKVLASMPDGSPAQVYAGYTYNSGTRGWIKARFAGGKLTCIELHDFAGSCRAVSQSPSQGIAALTIGMAVVAMASSSGGGSSSYSDNGGSSGCDSQCMYEQFERSRSNSSPPLPEPAPYVEPIGGAGGFYGCASPPCM